MIFCIKRVLIFQFIILLVIGCTEKVDDPCDIKYKVIGYNSTILQKQTDDEDFNFLSRTDSVSYSDLCISLDCNKLEKERKFCLENIKLHGSLTGFNIYSNSKFNDNHANGESLNDIISVVFLEEDYTESNHSFLLKELSYPQKNKLGIRLFLTEKPDSIRKHIFNIEILNEDTCFVINTNSIVIKP